MFRLERFLFAFAILGILWRIFIPPHDPLILLLGFGLLTLWFPLLGIIRAAGNGSALDLAIGFLSGVAALDLLVYLLGWLRTDVHLIVTGSFALLAILLVLSKRTEPARIYRTRMILLLILLLAGIALRETIFRQPVLQYWNPAAF